MKGKTLMILAWSATISALIFFACAQTESARKPDQAIAMKQAPTQGPTIQTVAARQEEHPEVDFTESCFSCHKEITPDVAEQWYGSMHGKVNIGCFICHGDGTTEFTVKPTTDRCLSCHSPKEVDFSKTEASSCFSCHNGHTLKFHE